MSQYPPALDCRAVLETWQGSEMLHQPMAWMKKLLALPSVAALALFQSACCLAGSWCAATAGLLPADPATTDLQAFASQPRETRSPCRDFSCARLAYPAPACQPAVAMRRRRDSHLHRHHRHHLFYYPAPFARDFHQSGHCLAQHMDL